MCLALILRPTHMTTILLAADRAESAIASLTDKPLRHCYEPFGHGHDRSPGGPAFNGVYQESITLHYLLGNGYRAYSPQLRRFLSPDSLSPFRDGGLNSYAYCKSDPINATDPTGHMPKLNGFNKKLNSIKKNNAFTNTYTNSAPLDRRVFEMGNLDSDGIEKFLINRGDQAKAGLAATVDNYSFFKELNTDPVYRERLLVQKNSAEKMYTALNDTPKAHPDALIASTIALNDNHPLQQEAQLFVSRTVDRLYEKISPAMHLRMREILQRRVRKHIGIDTIRIRWYQESIEFNQRLRQTT